MPEPSIRASIVGKVVKKILIGIAIIVSAGLLIPAAFLLGGATLAYSLVAIQLLGVSTIINAFSPDIDTGAGSRLLAENLSIFSSATAVRTIVFGRAGIAGQVLFRENIRNSGSDPDELLIILGLGGYPVTSLEKFWLNGELVFDGDSTTGPGAITTGKFANELVVDFRTGEEVSSAFPGIASLSTDWNAKTRILRGIPCLGIRLKITEKVDGRFQPLAQIKGSKLYDPRLDSTIPGGSGTHRFADPTTWAFSVNPKLAELLYLRGADVNGTRIFGMGKAAAAIDLENYAAEASVCEEQINVVGGGTIDRYTCNGVLIPGASHKTNLQRLLSASAGTMDASGGVYRTFAGAWRSPSLTFTETDIDGAPTDMQLQIDPSKEINVISGVFAEPDEMWVVKEYPELTDAASITVFGENSKKLDLPFTTDHRIAQRISKIQMKRLNARRAFNANYWLRAASLQPGDILTQTYARYGITAETFRIDFWALEASEDTKSNRRLLVTMRLVEELQSWFDWDESTEEKSINAGGTLPSTAAPRITEVFYIKPITGTAIQNGVGTLTVEAHRIFEGVDELLSAGTIQLFEGSTLITVANGYAAGSDGFTGVFDSGDISGSAIVELKDGAAGDILDTITLVDVLDGAGGTPGDDAVYGSIEPENGLAWTRAINTGPWTPSQLTTDLDCTFFQGGVAVARIARRVTLNSSDGTLTVGSIGHKGGDLNTSRVTVIVVNSGTTAVTVQFDYSFGGDSASVAETVSSAQGGDDGATGATGAAGADAVTGFVEPENGLAWTRAPNQGAWTPSQLTTDIDATFTLGGVVVARIARRITLTSADGTLAATTVVHKGGDLNTGRVTVTVSGSGSTAITVQFDYSFGGDTGSAAATIESAQGGDDGRPGLPGASTLALYDNADTNGSSSSQGRYHFLTSIVDTSGTFSWTTITSPSGIDYISVHKDSTGGTTDYSSFYDQTQVGDIVTWYSSDGRWVSFEITSIETAPTDMYKWGVSYSIHDEFDGSQDIPSAAGNDVIFRWSRAAAGGPVVTLSGETISDSSGAGSTATVRLNGGGNVFKITTTGGTVQIDVATDWVRPIEFAPGEFEHKATATGDTLDGSSDPLNTWVKFTTVFAPEWTLVSGGAEADKHAVVTIEIRFSGGAVLDSGVYSLNTDDLS